MFCAHLWSQNGAISLPDHVGYALHASCVGACALHADICGESGVLSLCVQLCCCHAAPYTGPFLWSLHVCPVLLAATALYVYSWSRWMGELMAPPALSFFSRTRLWGGSPCCCPSGLATSVEWRHPARDGECWWRHDALYYAITLCEKQAQNFKILSINSFL